MSDQANYNPTNSSASADEMPGGSLGLRDIFYNTIHHFFGHDGYDALKQGRWSLAVVIGIPLGWIANILQVFGPAISEAQKININFALYLGILFIGIAILLLLPVYFRTRYCRACAFPCVATFIVAVMLLALFGVQLLSKQEETGLKLEPAAWRTEFEAWGEETFPQYLKPIVTKLDEIDKRLSAIERIADALSKSNLQFNDPVHWADMTGGIASGYFQNFIRQFVAKNGPIADGSFSRLIIIKPHSLSDFTDPMNEFYQARSRRITRKQTFAHESLPRKQAVIDVFDGHYIVDYPTPLNSLRNTISFDSRRRNIPFNRKDLQVEYEKGLIEAFFFNLEELIKKDENYKLKGADIDKV